MLLAIVSFLCQDDNGWVNFFLCLSIIHLRVCILSAWLLYASTDLCASVCVSVCVPVVSDRLCPGGEQWWDGLLCLLNHCWLSGISSGELNTSQVYIFWCYFDIVGVSFCQKEKNPDPRLRLTFHSIAWIKSKILSGHQILPGCLLLCHSQGYVSTSVSAIIQQFWPLAAVLVHPSVATSLIFYFHLRTNYPKQKHLLVCSPLHDN